MLSYTVLSSCCTLRFGVGACCAMTLLHYGRQHIEPAPTAMLQILNLEGQLKTLHKAHEGSKLNLTQAIEACNFATKKRRAAERQLAKLQVSLSNLTRPDICTCFCFLVLIQKLLYA